MSPCRRRPCCFALPALLLLLWSPGCDRQSSNSQQTNATTQPQSPSRALAVQLTPITPLLPRLRTHVALDSHGNLYWIQESEPAPPGGDLVFVMGNSGVPQTVPALAVSNLLAALGDEGRGGTGAIRSIAFGPGDNLYLLFAGGSGRTPLWALFQFSPTENKLKLLADTQRLMADSQMGASIDLARGSLVSNGRTLWVWLRHSDDSAILQLIPREAGASIELRRLRLKPPKDVAQPNSEREDLCAGSDGSLYYVDRAPAMLWKIDPAADHGYTAVQSLDGLSRGLGVCAFDDAGGARVCVLAGDDDPLVSHGYVAPGEKPRASDVTWPQLSYPVFLELRRQDDGQSAPLTITREDFRALPALHVQDLQPRGLLLDRTNGTFITFDAATGELLRLKVVGK
jgi:hypothetical protein